jgi:hypothetical protein
MIELGASDENGMILFYKRNDMIDIYIDQINQEQFIVGVKKIMSRDQLEHIFQFHIIPSELVEDSNTLPPLPVPPPTLRNANDYDVNEMVTDDQLKQIAIRAAKRHWTKLALSLGFLEYDIEAYKAQNNYNAERTVTIFYLYF